MAAIGAVVASALVAPIVSVPILPAAAAAPLSSRLGYAVSSGSLAGYSPQALDSYFRAARRTGATTIRFDISWDAVEARRGQYDFAQSDAIVAAIVRNGMSPTVVLDYAPAWATANGAFHGAPTEASRPQWRDFVAATVSRYRDTIADWEIWNEPNLAEYWAPRPDPATYTHFLQDAYRAVKSIQPGASSTVLTAGLAPASNASGSQRPADFLAAIYRAGGQGFFDAVGAHPYTWPYDPTDPKRPNLQSDGIAQAVQMYLTMVRHGDGGKKMWATEVGFPTGSNPEALSPERQSEYLSHSVSLMLPVWWVGKVYLYTFRDTGVVDSAGPGLDFGVQRINGAPKTGGFGLARFAAG